ncbi:MAG: LuxR C-terminal-related transcriptional regulator [Faecalibacterium sp.]|jgi:LuxR family maltose regulon positive regulatory protein|nr:LuxR C-terminal-related transcriptional regulator [Faecalibacterium sp.]
MGYEAGILIKPALEELFSSCWRQYRVILFSAPCGVGKTTVAAKLLARHTVCTYAAAQQDCLAAPIPPACDAVLIDDFQLLQDEEEQQTVCAWIRANPDKHFVFLSRGTVPGWLMPFQFTGLLCTIDTAAMMFDRAATAQFLAQNGVTVTDTELAAIQRDTQGYPLLLSLLCRCMAGGEGYSTAMLDKARQEMYFHYEEAFYRRLNLPLRQLVLNLCPFEHFDLELAKMVSGDSHVGEMLGYLQRSSGTLLFDGQNQYHFWPVLRNFLLWELVQERTVPEQNALYSRAGLYYELSDDYAHALECYSRCGDQRKIIELLAKYAEHHPGVGQFYEMENYYYALPREEVLRSPALMCGMSMVTSLNLDYEASEQWYAELQSYAAGLKKSDAEYKDAQSKLAYLDIALPQRGSKGLLEIINSVFTILSKKDIVLPTFSVTSSLPSILNGGKDFSDWTKRDELLYATMRKPVEAVLGKDGIGLADCALCESKFEKDEDISARLLALVSRISEIHRKGTPDMEFAVTGLLARVQVSQGKAQAALETLQNLRDELADANQTRFLPNLDAMRCRIWLRMGEQEKAAEWLRTEAPPSGPRLRGLWRYRYITRAMAEITNDDCDEALLILVRLLPFTQQCARTLDALTIRLLMAICYFRQENETWKAEFSAALDSAWEYRYIRPVAQLGGAVLPLITACGWDKDSEYLSHLLAAARAQAVLYPDFLRKADALSEPLSPAETQVLRLICHNRSNQEIGDVLGIKLATVKTHVNHILQKLGVKRRSEAKAAAETLHLL